jgi:hypothetical protein
LFTYTLNKDFVCHYAFPICDEKKFEEILIEDFTSDVLRDKPEYIKDDDFLDKLY